MILCSIIRIFIYRHCQPYLYTSIYRYKINDDDKLMFHKFGSSTHDLGEKNGKAIHISNDFHFLLSRISAFSLKFSDLFLFLRLATKHRCWWHCEDGGDTSPTSTVPVFEVASLWKPAWDNISEFFIFIGDNVLTTVVNQGGNTWFTKFIITWFTTIKI